MNHKPLHITCSAFKLQRTYDKVQLILEEFNSPSEPAIPSTQKGRVTICPSQHFPPILTHQGASWSVSPPYRSAKPKQLGNAMPISQLLSLT